MLFISAFVILFRQVRNHEFVPILSHVVEAGVVVLEPTECLLANTSVEMHVAMVYSTLLTFYICIYVCMYECMNV